MPEAALVIDALFGAGLDRPPEGMAAALVAAMNRAPRVLAVDLPSGVDADSGATLGAAVRADATVTFFRKKPGHLLYPGRGRCGQVTVADIGIDAGVLAAIAPRAFENVPALWRHAVRPPAPEDHKYRRGHALVVSGPMARTGAARLVAGAALRAGAGLVTLLSPPDALAVNAAQLTAVMLRRIDGPEALAEALAEPRARAVAVGPALGTGAPAQALVAAALAAPPALVLDADGLTVWEAEPQALIAAIGARVAPTVLTPHEGEFARLFPDLADRPRTERARAAAARTGGGGDPEGGGQRDRRAGRAAGDQRQRPALARDRRVGGRARGHCLRPAGAGRGGLRGGVRRDLAARRRRDRGRARPDRRGSRARPPAGAAAALGERLRDGGRGVITQQASERDVYFPDMGSIWNAYGIHMYAFGAGRTASSGRLFRGCPRSRRSRSRG